MLAKLVRIREWESRHLPLDNSLIALSVLLVIARAQYANPKGATFKQVCLFASHSPQITRIHIKRMIATGWVIENRTDKDRRVKRFLLTEAARAKIDDYIALMRTTWAS